MDSVCVRLFYYKWVQCVRFSFTRNGFSVSGLVLLVIQRREDWKGLIMIKHLITKKTLQR